MAIKGFIPIAEAAAQLGLPESQVAALAAPAQLERLYLAAASTHSDERDRDCGFAVPPALRDAALAPFADGNLPPLSGEE